MKKEFIIVIVVMLFVWCSLLVFLWLKTDELTKNPCSICAEKRNETIMCSPIVYSSIPITRYYYPNGSIGDNKEEIKKMIGERIDDSWNQKFTINFSSVNLSE